MKNKKNSILKICSLNLCTAFCIVALFLASSFLSSAQILIEAAPNLGVTNIQTIDDDLANGMSFYDYNQDGWDDLTMPSGQDGVIFYKNNNGVFQQENLLTIMPGNIRQVIWIDYNQDGDLDLFITYYSEGVRLYDNDGFFNFSDVTQQVGINTSPFKAYGASFADPDADFDLDLYICAYSLQASSPGAMTNFYYENDGNNNYVNQSTAVGIDNGFQPTFMPVWYDFDIDGDVDLHLINDREYTSDALYLNDGAANFVNQASSLGISNDNHSPMSLSIGDFNNDGYFDVFESDIANGGVENGLPTNYKVFQNNAGLSFNDVASVVGVDTNFFAWGGLWVDYNNDSFEDLYIATAENDVSGVSEKPSIFYLNNGGNSFELANDSISANITHTSYSPVKGDINNDGFYDIAVLNGSNNPQNLLLNSGNSNNYIKITPVSSISNTQAIGGRIEVFANGEHQSRMIMSSDGMCAQNSQHVIFGIGSAAVVDSIRVTFPSGLVSTEYYVSVNQSISVLEYSSAQVSLATNNFEVCPGQSIVLSYPGLNNYIWTDGSTGPTYTVTQPGTYSFTAENQAGDTVFFLNPVTVNYEPPLLMYTNIIDNPCGLDSAGIIQVTCTPAQIMNSIQWSNGSQQLINTNLPEGIYTYEVTTNYGCTYSGSEYVSTDPEFDVQFMTSPYTDTSSGSVEIFIWGGVSPYEFTLDTIEVGSSISGLNPGYYTVQITDQNGCTDSIYFVIQDYSTLGTNIHEQNIWLHVDGENVTIFDPAISIESLEVYDLTGKKIKLQSMVKSNQGVKFKLTASTGLYQVRTNRWVRMINLQKH